MDRAEKERSKRPMSAQLLQDTLLSITGGVSEGGYITFHSAFINKMREEEAGGDVELAQALKLLAGVFSMSLQFVDGDAPFGPLMQDFQRGMRSMIPSDLTDQELDQLGRLLGTLDHPTWVARIADVLWVRRKNHLNARKAVAAYLQCAEDTALQWQQRSEYLRRAAHLATELGKTSAERAVVREVIMRLFQNGRQDCFNPERGHWPASLAEILVECRLESDWETLAQQCEEIARGFPISPGCDEPRTYYEIAAKCYRLAGQQDKAKQAGLAIAKHWEDEREVMAKQGASGLILANRLEEAVRAYRKVGGQQDKVDRLIQLWKEANTLAFGQMKEISLPVKDVTPIIEEVRKAMEGRIGDRALRGFISIHRPQSYEKIVEDVRRSAKEHPLQAIIGRAVLSPEGNQVAKVPGMLEDQDAAMTGAVVQQYNLGQAFVGATVLEQARSIIAGGTDGTWRESIKKLITGCPFIPEDRRAIYERGLIAGMEGDGITFAHVIVPQFEDLLRRLFQSFGLKTTKVKPDGVQEEYDLNDLLRDTKAEELLGKDILWEMRSALIEKSGWNMRNCICHGLTNASDFDPPSINFLFWFALFLILGLYGQDAHSPQLEG